MTDYSGKTIGEYQLIELIDQTGQALVYKGFQPSMNRYVELKILKPGAARDQTTVQVFNQFAEMAARLQHPGLLPVYDSGQAEGVFYRATPLMEQGSLADNLPAFRDPNQAFGLLRQIGAALDYLHGQGFIHGSLNLENILFDENQRPVLSEYGIASHFGETPTPFMSPEQIQGGVVDRRADTYALGVLLYTMLAGQAPPVGAAVSLRAVRPDLPQELEMLILKALAQNPDQRFQTPGEFSSALENALQAPVPVQQPAPAPTPYAAPPQPEAKKGPNWLAILLGGVLIVILCLCAVLVAPQVMEYFGAPTEVVEAPPPAPTEPQPGVTVVLPTRDERPTRPPAEIPTEPPPPEPTQPPEQPPEQSPEQPPDEGGPALPDICGSVGLIGGSVIFGGLTVSRRRRTRS